MSSYFEFIKEKIGDIGTSKILELGCGERSTFEDTMIKNVVAIDHSIDKILAAPESNIQYLAMDITNLTFSEKFDVIVDAHALHCIVDLNLREKAYQNIFSTLKEKGLFIAEVMIKKNSSDSYFSFPERIILSSYEIEDELVKNNFKIKYFSVIPNLYFLDDVSKKSTCDLLRFVAQK